MHNVSVLLRTIVPYYWVFAFFVLTPPPSLLELRVRCHVLNPKKHHSQMNCIRLLYILYSLLMVALAVRVTYVNNVAVDIVVHDFKLDTITSVLSITVNVSISVVQMLMQFSAIWDYRRLCQIFRDIAKLELDVSKQVCLMMTQTHTIQSSRRSFRWRLAVRSGALLLFLLILLPFVNVPLVADFMPLPDKILTILFSLLIQIKTVEYCVIVQLVHELLLQLQQQHLLPLQRQIVLTPQALRRSHLLALQANQHLLARIWNLVNAIEGYFTLPMFVLFLYNGLAVTHTMNWAYIRYSEASFSYNLFNISFTSILVVNMMVPCWFSQKCIDTYNQFGAVLHNLKSNGADVALNMRLREYSLQLMHQKIIFSCGGYFDINLKYFGGIILTVTTYVVILIQFKLQAAAEIEQQRRLLNDMQRHHA